MSGTVTHILYDPEDESIFLSRKWHISDTGYAVWRGIDADGIKKTIRLHRLINQTPEGLFTDHKNGNKLDNRRSNLRTVTTAENLRNIKTRKGYCWDKGKQLWVVRANNKFYGRYKTEAEAIKAAKLAKSGVPKPSRTHSRRRFLPRGVYFMQPMAQKDYAPYYIKPRVNGKDYFQGYFSTVQEAEQAYNNFLVQGG